MPLSNLFLLTLFLFMLVLMTVFYLEIQTATSIAASINALSVGPSGIRVRTFQVSTFCIYHWGFGYKMEWP